MTQFHVGQKVICINEDKEVPAGIVLLSSIEHPIKGKIYTIRDLRVSFTTGAPCILVEEMPDQTAAVIFNGELYFAQVLFRQDQFRPLVTRKTDISQFKAMLNPQKTEVTA